MKLAVIIVHYHTPELVPGACEALSRDAEASGLELEILLVDNGSRDRDRELWLSVPARRLDPGRNLGYAGGANLGVRESSAEHLVVGLPYELDGSEGRSARLARQVGDAVAELTGLPITYVDERYSSVEAERQLIEANVSRKKRKEIIDQAAAMVILQAWLNGER